MSASQDISRGNWLTDADGTTNLYQRIDEEPPNDTDYVKYSRNSVSDGVGTSTYRFSGSNFGYTPDGLKTWKIYARSYTETDGTYNSTYVSYILNVNSASVTLHSLNIRNSTDFSWEHFTGSFVCYSHTSASDIWFDLIAGFTSAPPGEVTYTWECSYVRMEVPGVETIGL
jgi:hypothetical protein